MTPRDRITMLVTVDLDPTAGEFATRESWKRQLARVMEETVGHYHPTVEVGDPTISEIGANILEKRLNEMEGYTPAIAQAVRENYPVEIALANDFHDLVSYRPMSEEHIAATDEEAWLN